VDDPAPIEVVEDPVFDLALTKTTTATAVAPGDDVTYTITVFNQGTVDAANILLTDYIPAGMTLNDADWMAVGSVAMMLFQGPIAAGTSATTDITLTVSTTAVAGDVVNFAEISGAEDTAGIPQTDADSSPDTNPFNDGTPIDDATTDPADEDDHDPATVTVVEEPEMDLALMKSLAAGQSTTVAPGDDVTFVITVTNQGQLAAQNVDVIDYIPTGLTLSANDTNGWIAAGANATNTIAGPIAPGSAASVEIVLTVSATAADGLLLNVAEITAAEDPTGMPYTDIDSTPDNNPSNDIAGEDDIDDEPLVVESPPPSVGDLALLKDLAAGQSSTVEPGDDVTFTISVTNQGAIAASNVAIVDYIPAGFTLSTADGNGWTGPSAGPVNNIIAGPIASGTTSTVDIILTLDPAFAGSSITNVAEIAGADDPNGDPFNDSDSTPDTDPTNDPANEDDIDDETVTIPEPDEFDLALVKTLSAGQANPVAPGDVVSYTITVLNQGAVDASNVIVSDYIPAGFSLNDPSWSLVGTTAMTTITGPIAAGSASTVTISLIVDPAAAAGTSVNYAEISGASDGSGNPVTDSDSTPDSIPGNDAGGSPDTASDNTTAGNGTGTPGSTDPTTDEDDSDPASIVIAPLDYDLALTKDLAPGESTTVMSGDVVSYNITVTNEGAVAASNITIVDMIPAGLVLSSTDANGWAGPSAGPVTNTIAGPIAPGASVTISIDLVVDGTVLDGSMINVAQITNDDGDDIDSTPNNNDPTEDDQDDAVIFGTPTPVFDLALVKSFAAGQTATVQPGDLVTYTLTVVNQGNVPAANVLLTDYIPSGFTLADANWTQVGTSAMSQLAGPIAPGASTTVDITFQVNTGVTDGAYTNFAEISAAEDDLGNTVTDIDSTPDTNPSNDGTPIDNATTDPNDEDDSDPETITVVTPVADVSLMKDVMPTMVNIGDQVIFSILVMNDGPSTATGVVVQDNLPSGYSYVSDNSGGTYNPGSGLWNVGTLAVGQTSLLQVTATVVSGTDLLNVAQVSATNEDDVDSTPGNNVPSEDDQDDAVVMIIPQELIDLEVEKSIDPIVAAVGTNVTFTVEVSNAGPNSATGVTVYDQLPSGLSYVSDNAGGAYNPATGMWNIGTVNVGQVVVMEVVATVLNHADAINSAQVFTADQMDVDSTPGNNNPNEDDQDSAAPIPPVQGPAIDLSVSKNVSPTFVDLGDQVTWTITLANAGPDTATGVTVLDGLNSGLMYVSDTGAGAYNPVTGIWSVGTIPSGGAVTLQIVTTITDFNAMSNTAQVQSANEDDVDSMPGNNVPSEDDQDSAAPVPSPMDPMVDLSLVKSVSPGVINNIGDNVTWTVTVTNAGPDTATGVTVMDGLNSGLVYVSDTGAGALDPTTGIWTIGSIAPGATVAIQIVTSVVDVNAMLNSAQVLTTNEDDIDSTPGNGIPSEDDQDSAIPVYVPGDCTTPTDCGTTPLCVEPITPITICPDWCIGGNVSITDAESLFGCSLQFLDDGCIIYTPLPGLEEDVLVVSGESDNGSCATITYDITVGGCDGENNPPVIDGQTDYCVLPITPTTICVDTFDPDGDNVTITDIETTFNCSISLFNDTCFIYTPLPGLTGTDTITVIACDDGVPPLCDELEIYVTIGCPLPVSQPDAGIITDGTMGSVNGSPANVMNGVLDIDVLANDEGPCDTSLSLTDIASPPSNGQAMINNGIIQYEPNAGFSGQDMLQYEVCNDCGECVVEDVTIDVIVDIEACENDTIFTCTAPITPLEICVDNFCALDDATEAIIGATTTFNCSISIEGTNCITYTPLPGLIGPDTITIVGMDGTGAMDTVIVVVTIDPDGDCEAPQGVVAVDDPATVDQNGSVDIPVLDNDIDNGGCMDPLTITMIVMAPQNGTATINMNGTITYEPNQGFTGMDAFTYEICNCFDSCDIAMVVIDIIEVPTDDPPVAVLDTDTTGVNTPVTIEVLTNDSDPDGDNITLESVCDPENGTAVIFGMNVVYVPNPGFVGLDTFCYVICDDTDPIQCDTGEIIVLVEDSMIVDMPPVIVDPNGNPYDDTYCTDSVLVNTQTLIICLDAVDPNAGENVEITITQNGTFGTATLDADGCLLYDAGADPGYDEIIITACDEANPDELCDMLTVCIEVVGEEVNFPPEAMDTIYYTTEQDMPFTDCIPVVDPNDDDVIITVINNGQNGMGTIMGDTCLTYVPNDGFVGNDTLILLACDDQVPPLCDTIVYIVTVLPVNDCPIAVNDAAMVEADGTVIIPILANDSDPDGDPLTVNILTLPANGTLTVNADGTVTYVPQAGFSGMDQFTYEICDGECCSPATVDILVGEPPVIDAIDDDAITPCGEPVTVGVLDNDIVMNADGDIIVFFDNPENGTIELNNATGEFVYTPNDGFCDGIDCWTYVIQDMFGQTDTAEVCVTVQPTDIECNGINPSAVLTPNDDGFNDVWTLDNIDLCCQTAEVWIFNRWGNIVYENSNWTGTDSWNGIWETENGGNGDYVPDGTYFYCILCTDPASGLQLQDKYDGFIEVINP